MPTLPTIPIQTGFNSRGAHPQLPVAGLQPLGSVARGIGQLAQTIGQTLQTVKDIDDAQKGTQAIADFDFKADEASQWARENSDPDTHLETWRQQVDQAKQEAMRGFATYSRQLQAHFTMALDRD